MDSNWRDHISIPDDLDEVIRQGIRRGREGAVRRDRRRRAAVHSVCTFAVVLGLLIGGIRLSPAFASAVRDIPVLGQLVQAFGKNEPLARGGRGEEGGTAALTMERDGDTERMRLDFRREDAPLCQAESASYPKTVTVTLPGTTDVEILSEISRAGDTSQYIKSVWRLPAGAGGAVALQLELESDADVQIQEYRAPGSLVIELTPTPPRMDTVYSVRTLSVEGEDLAALVERYADRDTRVLRDDQGRFFVELAQYASREEAEEACGDLPGTLIVEQRTANNVPVCFETMEAYESSRFLDGYYQVLLEAVTADPVLDFMDLHFAQATPEEQDVMLRGLTGLIRDEEKDAVDWARAADFYRLAGQELPDCVAQNLT